MTLVIAFLAGCLFDEKDVTYKRKTTPLSVYIEIPAMQHIFTEGYPKELVARVNSAKINIDDVGFIWTSDLDGDIGQGEIITTDILSIGEHVITLTAYDKNENVSTYQIQIKKLQRPNMPKIEKKVEKPIVYVDRVDGTPYIDFRDGTVLDKRTNLMWLKTDDGYDRPYVEAYNYCLDLEFAEYDDWRLPMLDELEEISNIGYGKLEPVLSAVFEAKNDAYYWTQTEYAFSNPSVSHTRFFDTVYYSWLESKNGFVGKTAPGGNEFRTFYARCVRDAR